MKPSNTYTEYIPSLKKKNKKIKDVYLAHSLGSSRTSWLPSSVLACSSLGSSRAQCLQSSILRSVFSLPRESHDGGWGVGGRGFNHEQVSSQSGRRQEQVGPAQALRTVFLEATRRFQRATSGGSRASHGAPGGYLSQEVPGGLSQASSLIYEPPPTVGPTVPNRKSASHRYTKPLTLNLHSLDH